MWLKIIAEVTLRCMPQNTINDKLILVQVMLGAVRQQAITSANVYPDLCHHMALLGDDELRDLSKPDD